MLRKFEIAEVSIAGIQKTIDNDILVIDNSFGFDTAVEDAQVIDILVTPTATAGKAIHITKEGRPGAFHPRRRIFLLQRRRPLIHGIASSSTASPPPSLVTPLIYGVTSSSTTSPPHPPTASPPHPPMEV
nr:ATP-dependent 6-phosphofructokinase 6 [Ipomoea batatas]